MKIDGEGWTERMTPGRADEGVIYALARRDEAEAAYNAKPRGDRVREAQEWAIWESVLNGALMCYLLAWRGPLTAEQCYELANRYPQRDNLITSFRDLLAAEAL